MAFLISGDKTGSLNLVKFLSISSLSLGLKINSSGCVLLGIYCEILNLASIPLGWGIANKASWWGNLLNVSFWYPMIRKVSKDLDWFGNT